MVLNDWVDSFCYSPKYAGLKGLTLAQTAPQRTSLIRKHDFTTRSSAQAEIARIASHKLYIAKTRLPGLHFVAVSMDVASVHLTRLAVTLKFDLLTQKPNQHVSRPKYTM